MCDRPLSIFQIHAPLDHRSGAPFYGRVDSSGLINPAMDDGQIGPPDAALLHLIIEDGRTRHVFRDDDKPAGIAVKSVYTAVDERNSLLLIVGSDAVPECILVMSDRRLDRKERRFIYHKKILILIYNIQLHRIRDDCLRRDFICEYNIQHIPLLKRVIREYRFPVQQQCILMMAEIRQKMAGEAQPSQKLRACRRAAECHDIFFYSIFNLPSHLAAPIL